VWHRRAGKDSVALNLTARDMFRRVGTYWHLFPEQTQARRAVWNGIDRNGRRIIDQVFPAAVRRRVSGQEMLVETLNGSIWQMAGSDNYDSLVGSNPVGVVFSEWSLANLEAWEYIRPILVENDGWALFIFTPRGRNHGYTTWLNALDADSWFCERLTVEDTGLITSAQIDEERRAGMSEGKIRQEFHCSFEAASDEQLIPHALVDDAMARCAEAERFDEKVIGVDVARYGDDKSAIWFRHGRDGSPRPYERLGGLSTMELAARVAERIDRWGPDAVFVDDGGVGGGVVDRLLQLGFRMVRGVNFGARSDSARTGEKAGNKRSEMWLTARAWLETGALAKDDLLLAELTAPMFSYNAQNALMLEKKEDMKKRGIPSPDVADAFALTFAYPVMAAGFDDEDDGAAAWQSGRSLVTGY
jgi:phage terminase large subunit